jgi:HSP20 family protein
MLELVRRNLDPLTLWDDSLFDNIRSLKTAITPSIDIWEEDNAYTVQTEMPGLDKENIEIVIENNNLVIKGNKKTEKETKNKNYIHKERSSCNFVRSIAVDASKIESDKIDAKYKNGILEVMIPKKEAKKDMKKNIVISD